MPGPNTQLGTIFQIKACSLTSVEFQYVAYRCITWVEVGTLHLLGTAARYVAGLPVFLVHRNTRCPTRSWYFSSNMLEVLDGRG